jgi:hypothetical protein
LSASFTSCRNFRLPTKSGVVEKIERSGVLGLVVGYSGEASSDVHRVADLVATRLASKHLEYVRKSEPIAKAMQTQRICRAWVHSFARGFARVILDRMRKILTSWVDNPRPLGCPQMNWGRTLKKALLSNDLPTEFVKWREMAADRNQWRAICGSKMPIATKETPTSSRQDIWAKLRYGNVPS